MFSSANHFVRTITNRIRLPYDFLFRYLKWSMAGWPPPAAPQVKRAVLQRYGTSATTWIETGTYLGQTTKFLARNDRLVWSIEPEPSLARAATKKFRGNTRVKIVQGTSEEILPTILPQLSGKVAFWLDGHYSAGVTFRGDVETPIASELDLIKKSLHLFESVVVLVDDFRCFEGKKSDIGPYPPRSSLVEWADSLNFSWTVEHDIFIAWGTGSKSPQSSS